LRERVLEPNLRAAQEQEISTADVDVWQSQIFEE